MGKSTFKPKKITENKSHKLACNSYSIQNQGNTYVKVNEWVIPPYFGSINVEPPGVINICWDLVIEFIGQMDQESEVEDNNKILLIEYIYESC